MEGLKFRSLKALLAAQTIWRPLCLSPEICLCSVLLPTSTSSSPYSNQLKTYIYSNIIKVILIVVSLFLQLKSTRRNVFFFKIQLNSQKLITSGDKPFPSDKGNLE